jgi:hypothetical protein
VHFRICLLIPDVWFVALGTQIRKLFWTNIGFISMVIETPLNSYQKRIENKKLFDSLQPGQYFSESFFDVSSGTRKKVIARFLEKLEDGLLVESSGVLYRYHINLDADIEIEDIILLCYPEYKSYREALAQKSKYNDYFCQNFNLISERVIEIGKTTGKDYGTFNIVVGKDESDKLCFKIDRVDTIFEKEGDVWYQVRLYNGRIY